MTIGGIPFFAEGLLTAMAPALFEEVIFRGIFISNLKKNNKSDMYCLFVSAAVFALIHLTNIVGMSMTGVLVQAGYSFVIGLVLAAVYLRNGSLLQVVIVHFLIDFTSRIFVEQASISSVLHLILFVILLAAEAVYAIVIVHNKAAQSH
jgi:membrane protease YdiL (CAAX protease family)